FVDGGRDLEADGPGALGRDDELEDGGVVHQLRRLAERHPRTSPGGAPAEAEDDVPRHHPDAVVALLGAAGPALLHLEQVGEVSREAQLDRAVGGLVPEVADLDVFAHPPTDVAVAEDEQGGVGVAGPGPGARDEHGGEGVAGGGGQGLGLGAVDPQLATRQEAGVPEEEALGGAGQHVAGASADGEGGPLDQGDGALHVPKRHGLALEPPRLGHRSKRYDGGPLRTRGSGGRVAGGVEGPASGTRLRYFSYGGSGNRLPPWAQPRPRFSSSRTSTWPWPGWT